MLFFSVHCTYIYLAFHCCQYVCRLLWTKINNFDHLRSTDKIKNSNQLPKNVDFFQDGNYCISWNVQQLKCFHIHKCLYKREENNCTNTLKIHWISFQLHCKDDIINICGFITYIYSFDSNAEVEKLIENKCGSNRIN